MIGQYALRPTRLKRLARLAFALMLPLALGAAGQQTPFGTPVFTEQQQADIAKVNAYLNSVRTLKSNFVQLGPDGQLGQGTVYLEKPGKMRFEYQPPSPTLVVATGGNVYVRNARLNTVDRYSLSNTPLTLLLNDDVDLRRNGAVMGIEEQADALIVHARSSSTRHQSNITLVFSFPTLELRQWMVRDDQGGVTTVALTGTLTGVALDDALFAVPAKTPALKKSGG